MKPWLLYSWTTIWSCAGVGRESIIDIAALLKGVPLDLTSLGQDEAGSAPVARQFQIPDIIRLLCDSYEGRQMQAPGPLALHWSTSVSLYPQLVESTPNLTSS